MLNNLLHTFFFTASIETKLDLVGPLVEAALDKKFESFLIKNIVNFDLPLFRTGKVCAPQFLPDKPRLSATEGQARLIHDLTSIELQACEVMMRTLIEFPNANHEFRESLGEIIKEEAEHCKICINGLASVKYKWGHWPVHIGLWESLKKTDSLIDRVVIIHRYLEGSGLDAGAQILRRINGVQTTREIYYGVRTIFAEELAHVSFGSKWYRQLCFDAGLDPQVDFPDRMEKLSPQLPRRLEKLDHDLRTKAGFTLNEINYLELRRLKFLNKF